MKFFILSFAALTFFSSVGQAEEPLTLRQRMTAMGYILDEVWVHSAKSEDYLLAADKVRDLRAHLVQAIGLLPGKFAGLTPAQQRIGTIEYHQLAARVIFLSGTLELAFMGRDFDPIGPTRELAIQNLLREISVIVGQAHGKFR